MTNRFTVYIVLLAAFFISQPAWAINPPEPQSGGKFFPGKGTRAGAASQNYYDEYNEYTRSESSSFDRQHYGKGLKAGVLQLRPSLGYTGEFDSNIFLKETDHDSDYINRLTAGLDADLPMGDGKYFLTGGIRSESEWFANHKSQNHTDWLYQLGGELNFQSFNLAFNEEFRDTTDRSSSDLTQRVSRYENRLGGVLTVPFARFFSETEINDFIARFRDDGFKHLSRHEFRVSPRLGVDVGAKTQALTEFNFTNIDYRKQEDRGGQAYEANLGLRGILGDKNLITYQAWGGWQFRHYDSSAVDGFNSFVGRAALVYDPSVLTKISLRLTRTPVESLLTGQNFYTRNDASLQYRRQIAESWFANVQGAAGFNHYSDDRLDFLWEPGAGLEYVLPGKIFALFTEYKFSARESNSATHSYTRHIVDFGIRAQV